MKAETLHIKAKKANADTWFEIVSDRLNVQVDGNKLHLDPTIGSGFICNTKLQSGLSYLTADVWLKVDFVYERNLNPGEDFYLILIGLSPGPILYFQDKEYAFDKEDNFKAIIISPNTPSTLYVKKHESLRMLNILVSKKWIEDNVMDSRNKIYIKQILKSKSPLVLKEDFDPKHRDLIKALFNFRYKDKIKKLSAVVSTISFLVKSISERVLGIEKQLLNDEEAKAIESVCLELQRSWKKFPSLSKLSRIANMGESSFKRKFKIYTSVSPYQFYLKIKLEKARDMLENKEMSVSEVGYECGYSNLSHFTRQFKKVFGILPKDVKDGIS